MPNLDLERDAIAQADELKKNAALVGLLREKNKRLHDHLSFPADKNRDWTREEAAKSTELSNRHNEAWLRFHEAFVAAADAPKEKEKLEELARKHKVEVSTAMFSLKSVFEQRVADDEAMRPEKRAEVALKDMAQQAVRLSTNSELASHAKTRRLAETSKDAYEGILTAKYTENFDFKLTEQERVHLQNLREAAEDAGREFRNTARAVIGRDSQLVEKIRGYDKEGAMDVPQAFNLLFDRIYEATAAANPGTNQTLGPVSLPALNVSPPARNQPRIP